MPYKTTNDIFEALGRLIPSIPKDNVTKLKLTLDFDKIPTLEITTYVYESELLTPETETKTFKIVEIKHPDCRRDCNSSNKCNECPR